MSEEWRAVPDHEDYEVSSLGRVRSWKRRSYDGRSSPSEPRIISPKSLNAYGHKFFEVWFGGRGKRKKYNLHRTILTLFVRAPMDGEVARHLNGDPSDNRLENLAWGSCKDNGEDMVRHGNSGQGERNVKAVLTERDVYLINRMAEHLTCKQIAEVFEVSTSAVNLILGGRNWRHVAS